MRFKDIVFILIYLVFALMGMTLIKIGARTENHKIFQIGEMSISTSLILGVFCYGISFCLYVFVISQMQISLAITIASAINSVATIVIGIIVFHEILNIGQVIGAAIIITGVFILGIFSN